MNNQFRKLIIKECSCFQRVGPFGIKNHCFNKKITKGKFVCIFFQELENEFPRCWWFEKYVLPLDAELNEDFKNKMEDRNGGKAEDRPVIQREGIGGSPRGIKGVTPQPQKPGLSVGQSLRKGILPRSTLHGVGS